MHGGAGRPDLTHPPTAAAGSRHPFAPLALAAALLSFTALPRVHGNAGLLAAFVGAAGALVLWTLVLRSRLARGWDGAACFRIEPAPPVRAHYVQASVQLVLYAYWGWYWREVYAQVPLILAQLVFLYGVDALLSWSRGRAWRLGFGPLPIILSANVFIWFIDDWFVFQFLLVATGALGKEFIKWERDGRRTHVFNPSAFTLGLFSAALIATGTSKYTWAGNIAATISDPPHIYVVIFALGLVVQYCFSITLMVLSAAATLAALTLGYHWATGNYYFLFSNVPAPVFLGLHLLVTDPSTSPRTSGGRVIFGALYGLGAFVFFGALHNLDGPTIYDKLLPVPLLNLCVRAIDRWTRTGPLSVFDRWEAAFRPARMNLAYMGGWSVLFLGMLSTGYVQAPHEGNTPKFWRRALEEGQPFAARGLIEVLDQNARLGSAAAWNELGELYREGRHVEADPQRAARSFARAARLGDLTGSARLAEMILAGQRLRSEADVQRAFDQLEQACRRGGPPELYELLARAYASGVGRPQDPQRAQAYRRQAELRGAPSERNLPVHVATGAEHEPIER